MARSLDDTGKHLIRILRQGGQAASLVEDAIFDGRDDILRKIKKGLAGNASQAQLVAMVHQQIGLLDKNINSILVDQGTVAGEYQAASSAKYLQVLGVANPKTFSVTERFIRNSFRVPMPSQNIAVADLLTGTMAGLDIQLVNITRTAIAQGQTIAKTASFIEDSSGALSDPALKRKSQALARTAITQVANDVRARSFAAESEVEGVLYVATLDHRTSDICKSLDGTFYEKKSEARIPPLHVSCRSTLVPVLKGETLNEVKDQLQRPAVEVKSVKELEEKGLRTRYNRIRKPSRRDSSPLKGVVKSKYVTYEEWIKTQPVAYQKKILGTKAFNKLKETGSLKTALGVAE